jgi:hypothetical protein
MLVSGSAIVARDSDQSCWRRRESLRGSNENLRGRRMSIAGSDRYPRGSIESSGRSIMSLARAITYTTDREMTVRGAPMSVIGPGNPFPRSIRSSGAGEGGFPRSIRSSGGGEGASG